jgi:hypothetical protein
VTKPGLQSCWTGEGPLHRHLLIEQHADQQCRAIGVEQSIGVCLAGDIQGSGHEGILLDMKKVYDMGLLWWFVGDVPCTRRS